MFIESAIGQHLLDKHTVYAPKITKIKNLVFFHLSALEAIYIKSCQTNICREKDFVYNLKILARRRRSHRLKGIHNL